MTRVCRDGREMGGKVQARSVGTMSVVTQSRERRGRRVDGKGVKDCRGRGTQKANQS